MSDKCCNDMCEQGRLCPNRRSIDIVALIKGVFKRWLKKLK